MRRAAVYLARGVVVTLIVLAVAAELAALWMLLSFLVPLTLRDPGAMVVPILLGAVLPVVIGLGLGGLIWLAMEDAS